MVEWTGVRGAAQARCAFHRKTLKQAVLVPDRPDGRWVYYSLRVDTLAEARELLERLAAPTRHPLPVLADAVVTPNTSMVVDH